LQAALRAGEVAETYAARQEFTVAKVQIALLGSARALQEDLQQIAMQCNTATAAGAAPSSLPSPLNS
jgi:uncharacterized membrane protein